MTISTATVSNIPHKIEWTALSTSSRWTLQQVAFPVALGYSEREIASSLGRTQAFVKAHLDALRVEILEQ